VAVKAPGYGDRRKAMLEDIAILTDCKTPVFKDTGTDLETLDLKGLGRAKKVTVTADNTTIVEGAGSKAKIDGRIAQIRREIEDTTSNYDREKLEERLAKLAGGVAQINVGAATETEMKEKKARIKDAHASLKAALEEGVLPGGGVALLRTAVSMNLSEWSGDVLTGARILQEALRAPFHQIVENAGGHGAVAAARVLKERKSSIGYNVETDTYSDLLEDGVIDPCKVTTTALSNAVSVATMLISTNCLVTEAPKKEEEREEGGGEDLEE
jgi:chaperonin GroEL